MASESSNRNAIFFQDSVEYLGHIMSKEGISISPDKVSAIADVPSPTDVSKLHSFLVMVNHNEKFIKNLTDLCAPLNKLLRKSITWNWTEQCQQNFAKIKETLISGDVLAHFDPSLPLGITCDASSICIGAILFHSYPERPIAYASKSLTSAEQHYSQIEREALSIIFGVRKFHQFLYGRTFTLLTDHKPLLTIFWDKKGIPTVVASKLQ